MKSMEEKKILKVMIHGADKKTLNETLQEYPLDVGCAGLMPGRCNNSCRIISTC